MILEAVMTNVIERFQTETIIIYCKPITFIKVTMVITFIKQLFNVDLGAEINVLFINLLGLVSCCKVKTITKNKLLFIDLTVKIHN